MHAVLGSDWQHGKNRIGGNVIAKGLFLCTTWHVVWPMFMWLSGTVKNILWGETNVVRERLQYVEVSSCLYWLMYVVSLCHWCYLAPCFKSTRDISASGLHMVVGLTHCNNSLLFYVLLVQAFDSKTRKSRLAEWCNNCTGSSCSSEKYLLSVRKARLHFVMSSFHSNRFSPFLLFYSPHCQS
jgi:hypothetical protein